MKGRVRTSRPKSSLALILAVASVSAQAETRTPISQADRAAILNLLRQPLEKKLTRPVKFVITDLHGRDGWAFVQVEPQRPGGRRIDGRAFFRAEWE